MKVILLVDVQDVGKRWETHEVADGYARNTLIPRGLAAPVTQAILKKAEEAQSDVKRRAELSLKKSQELASSIDGFEVTIPARANEHGELYAAVNLRQISDAFQQEGYAVPQKAIRVTEALKHVGEYTVPVVLDHGLEVQIKVIIEAMRENISALRV